MAQLALHCSRNAAAAALLQEIILAAADCTLVQPAALSESITLLRMAFDALPEPTGTGSVQADFAGSALLAALLSHLLHPEVLSTLVLITSSIQPGEPMGQHWEHFNTVNAWALLVWQTFQAGASDESGMLQEAAAHIEFLSLLCTFASLAPLSSISCMCTRYLPPPTAREKLQFLPAGKGECTQ